MTQSRRQRVGNIARRLAIEFLLPAFGFALGVGYATRSPLPSLVAGLCISGAIGVLHEAARIGLYPRVMRLARDWLHIGLRMALLLVEHVGGAALGLWVSHGLFAQHTIPLAAWGALGGMVLAFPIIHGTGLALGYYRRMREEARRAESLRALATQAELQALRAQINPHFLFNTLNTIASLVHENPDRAEATIERLAELFRYVLASDAHPMVPLAEELAFCDGFLEIESLRYGDRLQVSRHVQGERNGPPLEARVPNLILQPLVENAIRHGQGPDGCIDLRIEITADAQRVRIAVADQGPGMPADYRIGAGPGVGLRNVDERLTKTYGPAHGVKLLPNPPHGTVVVVEIPTAGGTP